MNQGTTLATRVSNADHARLLIAASAAGRSVYAYTREAITERVRADLARLRSATSRPPREVKGARP